MTSQDTIKLVGYGLICFFIIIGSVICGISDFMEWSEGSPTDRVILFGWIIFIILILGAGLFVVFIIEPKARKKHEIAREQNFIQKKSKLVLSDDYKYIKNFVTKYKDEFDWSMTKKLQDLLARKGFDFDKDEISWLLMDEAENQDYENFKRKIISGKPKKLEEYIHIFLTVCGDNYLSEAEKGIKVVKEKTQDGLDTLKEFVEKKQEEIEGKKKEEISKSPGVYFEYFYKLLVDLKINGVVSEEQLMRKIEEIRKEIELSYFKRQLESEQLSFTSLDELDLMTGEEFENFLRSLFEKMGYNVEQTKVSHDQGADLILSKFGEKIVVQAKRYSDKVGNKAIQEAVASIKHYRANRAMVITTSEFSRSAIELAASNNIELITRGKLENIIKRTL